MTTNPLNPIQDGRINTVIAATEELTKALQTHPLDGAIVRDLEKQTFTTFDNLLYDLHRHIELEGDEHGPRALQLIDNLCGNDNLAWQAAEEVAQTSIRERTALRAGVVRPIEPSLARAP